MSRPIPKLGCSECDWRGFAEDMLEAENPFEPDQMITGCPTCMSIDKEVRICDIKGCNREATCGTPVPDDREYVTSCGQHYQELQVMMKGD